MQQQNIMNVLLGDLVRPRLSDEITLNTKIISELVDGWDRQKYVFPTEKINFRHKQSKKYRLM
ncbi:MAG: hypothetical protein IJ218_03410 [Alphaproteobacteria bacterium]|nr:hypothetical protein [Alphaproteobacteria bacterium]